MLLRVNLLLRRVVVIRLMGRDWLKKDFRSNWNEAQ